jgi:hypothetical protein
VDNGPARNPEDLVPISPELALVDPVLAEQARKLLPDVVERPRPPAPPVVVDHAAPADPAPIAVEPAPAAPRRRWRRMLVLAVLVFVAGAISSTLLGGKNAGPGGVTLGVPAEAPSTQPSSVSTQTARASTTSRPTTRSKGTTTRPTLRPPSPRGQSKNGWTSNVLGVEAQVDAAGVTLSWQRPASSGHVVIRRGRGAAHGGVVYQGRAASYSDPDVQPCTAYNYTIVNYDRRGHPSTGVPTSVVTSGCS